MKLLWSRPSAKFWRGWSARNSLQLKKKNKLSCLFFTSTCLMERYWKLLWRSPRRWLLRRRWNRLWQFLNKCSKRRDILFKRTWTILCPDWQNEVANQKPTCHVDLITIVAIDLKQRFGDIKVSSSSIQIKEEKALTPNPIKKTSS